MTRDIELLDALRLYQLLSGDTEGHERTCPCRPCARRKSWAQFCANASQHTPDYEGVLNEVARDV